MSEFSESYHLRTERSQDAIELLKRAGRKGYVFEPTNGWVTFLAEENEFEPDEQVVAAAKHPLLHYVCAQDHGCGFTLFDGTNIVCAYRCDWEYDVTVDDSRYSHPALMKLVPTADSELLNNFERWSPPEDPDEPLEEEPSKLFAQAIGLEHYDWLAYDYLEAEFGESPEDYPGVTEVA
jgi:hypothetical protein